MNNRKGFTLIELLVVVLIIGILAAMALPQYFKAVERSRMAEAEQLLASIAQAQQRKYLQINSFAHKYTGLDVAPKGAPSASTYFTKGDGTTEAKGNGFKIVLGSSDVWGTGTAATTSAAAVGLAVATRQNAADEGTSIQYAYNLTRYYGGEGTTCIGTNANGAALCADFCGIDDLATSTPCCNTTHAKTYCPTPTSTGAGN